MASSMKLTAHGTSDQFLVMTREALLREEAANNLMLGVALRIRGKEGLYHLITVHEGRKLALAALQTPPFPVTLFCPGELCDEALTLVANHLYDVGAQLPGVSGRSGLPEQFAKIWSSLKNVQFHEQLSMRVYQLREVIPPPARPGYFRIATMHDLPVLTEWMRAFLIEALHGENADAAGETTQRRINDGELFVWDIAGHPVTMAASTRPLIKGITVNMVYTPPELRGRGYASVCVAALSRHLLNEGWAYCALFTDLGNPTSNSIYQKIGYRPLCDFVQYAFY